MRECENLYDVAIIGLGPAGAVFAKYLPSNLKVIAIDKKSENAKFQKPCGGLLAPDAQKSLSRFNMTLPKDVLVNPQIFSVKTIDLNADKIRHYQRFYINLDRDKFDKWLISQIPDSVEICENSVCTELSKADGIFSVTFRQGDATRIIKAKYIVGADGANSVVRRTFFPKYKVKKYLAIQQRFKVPRQTPFYSCVFDSQITDSYAWGLTKDDEFIFGGAFNVKTAKSDFAALKSKMLKYGFSLDEPVTTEACLVLRPVRRFCTGADGVFLIGEAAGFISPSSLEGISYALDSGYVLSQCFGGNVKNPNGLYKRKTFKIRVKLTLKMFKRPFMYNRFLRKIIMKTGLLSIDVLE